MFPVFPDVCVNEMSKAQRGAVPSSGSHSRSGGDWDPPGLIGVLAGWGQWPDFWPATALPLPSSAHLHHGEPRALGDPKQVTPPAEPLFPHL